MSKTIKQLCLLFAMVLCAGCSQPATVESESNKKAAPQIMRLDESQQQQRAAAIAAKEKLFQSLLGELTSSIGENGVAQSIEVCKTKAPELARMVSEEMNLKIGRTSFLLRNDKSAPPAWAASHVQDRVENEVNVDLGEDRLGVLLPIRLNDACIQCHGQSDAIDATVQVALATHYPNDQATSFAAGDLRGYFWVEVPSRTP